MRIILVRSKKRSKKSFSVVWYANKASRRSYAYNLKRKKNKRKYKLFSIKTVRKKPRKIISVYDYCDEIAICIKMERVSTLRVKVRSRSLWVRF